MKRPFGMIYKSRKMNFELRVQWFFLFRCHFTTQYSYASRMMLNTMERCVLDFDDTSSSNLSFGVIGDDFNCARLKSQVSQLFCFSSERKNSEEISMEFLFYFHNLSHFPWSDFGNVARDVFLCGGKKVKKERRRRKTSA